jgi:hypothetical protein
MSDLRDTIESLRGFAERRLEAAAEYKKQAEEYEALAKVHRNNDRLKASCSALKFETQFRKMEIEALVSAEKTLLKIIELEAQVQEAAE